jgi:acetyl esterase/lipase
MTIAPPRWAQGVFAAAAIILGAVAVFPGAIVNAIAAFQSYSALTGVAYGKGARRGLDAYLPAASSNEAPIIVLFHGGSWSAGAKEDYRFVGAALSARGFIVVIPDYRQYPDARFPAFLVDAAQAVRWARDNAALLHGDARRVFVMGHSAGAHIAMMLAFDRQWLGAVGLAPERDLAGAIGLAGPYNFVFDTDLLRGVFGSAPDPAAAQPVNFVTRAAPPVFLATGADDEAVKPRNTRDLAERIRAVGGEPSVAIYPGVGHRDLIGSFSPALRFLAPVLDDVSAFIERISARKAAPTKPNAS